MGAVVLGVEGGAVVALVEPPAVVAVVDDVSPAAAVVLEPVEPVRDVDVDDEVDAPVDASSSFPRFPGWAIARTTPTMKRRAAAAPRIANRRFRGDSPHFVWSG